MTTASQEVSEIDANARFPLSLLLGTALLWLVVSGALALLSFAQALNPRILEDCAFFTFGRTRAMQETALIYGWVANAGFAVALWTLGRAVRRKGMIGGTVDTALDFVPFVGAAKNTAELVRGRDFIADR